MRILLLIAFTATALLDASEKIHGRVVDDCALGEEYWCLSMENAKKCEKIEKCFPSTNETDYVAVKHISEISLELEEIPLVLLDTPYGQFIG